jgi:hypothetical protein
MEAAALMPTEDELNLTPLERFERVCRADEAELAEKRAARKAWMTADIEAHLASIENHNEIVRVNEEHTARRAAARDAKKERALVERAMEEKRRRAAAELELTAQDRYTPVLGNGKKSVRGVFDFTTWTWDEEAQFTYWESQFNPKGLTVSPLPAKYELFLWATEHLLPLLKKHPSVWPVYCYLLLASPESFTAFKVSTGRLANGAAVSRESARTAVDYLHELKFLRVKKGLWSPEGPKAAILPVYEITPLGELKNRLTVSPLEERPNG